MGVEEFIETVTKRGIVSLGNYAHGAGQRRSRNSRGGDHSAPNGKLTGRRVPGVAAFAESRGQLR